MGFGDSSLDFELRCRINRIDRRFTVTSDINFERDAAFREAGITIPFPQRDLHIVTYPDQEPEPAPAAPAEETARTRTLAQPESVTRRHRQEIEIAAELKDVWKALTDAETMSRWIRGEVTFAPYIGGGYEFTLADGRHRGRIDVFMPPRRLRLVEAPRGREEPLPTGPITTELALSDADGKTKLTVTVAGIPATEDWEEDYNRSQTFWQEALVELAELLARK